MAYHKVPTGLVSHARHVCSLYKRAVRNLQAWNVVFEDFRYEAVMMRHRFDQNKDIKDMRVAKKLLMDGEEELWNYLHPQQIYFPDSPGGCAYEREVPAPDWVLDYWHQTEKDMYPKYFALREKRKKEWIKLYDKEFPDAQKKFDDHH